MKCNVIDFESADWARLDSFADRTIFQTEAWVRFVSQSQNATPVLAELLDAGRVVGYFTGLTSTKFGVNVLGTSFPGWTTPYIAFHHGHNVFRAEGLTPLQVADWE